MELERKCVELHTRSYDSDRVAALKWHVKNMHINAYYSTCICIAIMCMWIVNSHVLHVIPVILQLAAKPFQCRASSWPRSEVGGMRTINLWAAVVEKLRVIGCRAILMISFNQRQGRCFFTDKVRSKHFWFGDFATSLECISVYVCV